MILCVMCVPIIIPYILVGKKKKDLEVLKTKSDLNLDKSIKAKPKTESRPVN